MEQEAFEIAARRAAAEIPDDEIEAMLRVLERARAAGRQLTHREMLTGLFLELGASAEQAATDADAMLAEAPPDFREKLN